ncbi:MAG: hypothetical protein HND44_01410 [Chloroflexi bacterium]|nr:hypothetical protein [Chloroflexota bacterium]NOG33217.1 hypothetical protein [Chloroflexota bacterium]GIK55013.1 MAG: hypothetical protein BroJett015_06760 [Chloroflexota bacterium]
MKQMYRLFTILAVLAALGLLAACGGGEEEVVPTATSAPTNTAVPPTDTPVPPTNTPAPTDTPAPTNTPEPTATPDIAASFQELTNEDLGVTISHPAGWLIAAQDDGSLRLASSESLLNSTELTLEEGIIVQMMNLPLDMLAFLVTEGDPSDPVAVLNAFSTLFTAMSGTEEDITFTPRDEAAAVTIAGFDGATAVYDVVADGEEGLMKIATLADPDNNRILLIFAGTQAASEDQYLPIFDEMLETISLSEPAALDITGTTTPGASAGFLLPGDVVEDAIEDEAGDAWSYIALEGEVVDIIVEPSGSLDVVVDVLDANGKSVIGGERDDQFGTETISAFSFPAPGSYTIVVRGFAGATGDYTISVFETGAGSTSSGISVGDIAIGDTIEGTLEGSETASWTFAALENDLVNITVRPLDSDLDVVIDVVDDKGNSLAGEPTDASFGTEYIPVVRIPADGMYSVTISSFDGTGGDYEVTITYTNNGQTNTAFFATDELEEEDEEHAFPFNALEGDFVTIIVDPVESGFDLVISLYNDDTDELIDEVDASTGMEWLEFEVPENGNYYFTVTGYEGSVGNYEVALIGSEFVIFELAIGDEVFGDFGEENLLQYYLGGEPGDVATITVTPGETTDVVIRVLDLDGNVLAEVDDAFSGEAEVLEFTFGDEGLVIIELTDFFGSEGTYDMIIE